MTSPKSPMIKRQLWYLRSYLINASLAVGGLGVASYYYSQQVPQLNNSITSHADKVAHPMEGRTRSDFLSVSEAESRLRKYAKTYAMTHPIIQGISINKVASNEPIEDRNNIWNIDNDLLISVFDGHAGFECSAVASQALGSYVRRAFTEVKDKKLALSAAFNTLDKDISDAPKQFLADLPKNAHPNDSSIVVRRFMDALTVASSGSCAISAWVSDKDVVVANAGDARAIIGTFDNTFVELSHDQTPDNPDELQRMQKEHPGEESTVAQRGRVLGGLMPSRSVTFLLK